MVVSNSSYGVSIENQSRARSPLYSDELNMTFMFSYGRTSLNCMEFNEEVPCSFLHEWKYSQDPDGINERRIAGGRIDKIIES